MWANRMAQGWRRRRNSRGGGGEGRSVSYSPALVGRLGT